MKNVMKKNKGFTIVELVIVIAVIAILAGVLIPTFSGIVAKANQSKALQEATNAYKNLTYNSVNGESALIRDGYVFLSGDYAFTNIDGKLYQLEKEEEFAWNGDALPYFLVGSYSVKGGDPTDAIFELPNLDYVLYSVKHPEKAGRYYFIVSDPSAENNPQLVEGSQNIFAAACLYSATEMDSSLFAIGSSDDLYLIPNSPIIAVGEVNIIEIQLSANQDSFIINVSGATSVSFNDNTSISAEGEGSIVISAVYLKNLLKEEASKAGWQNIIVLSAE